MAIIQSILVGKGKGKIGNVVLSGLKGQTVAKQLNSSPSNPRTVAQTVRRVKMSNAVLAWQFLANFFSFAKSIRKPLESVYNAFVRTVITTMSDQLESSRALAAVYALDLKAFVGNWFTISTNVDQPGMAVTSFNSSGFSWASSYRVVCLYFNSSSGEQKVIERALTESEFSAGEVSISISGISNADSASAYIYDSATSKITNISYVGF